MKISVTVKPNSRKESFEVLPDGSYLLKVRAPATEGKANERVIEMLSENLKKPKSAFELISGHRGKKKTFTVS